MPSGEPTMPSVSSIFRASLIVVAASLFVSGTAFAQTRQNTRRLGGGTIQEPSRGRTIQPAQTPPQPPVAPPVAAPPVALGADAAELIARALAHFNAGNLDEAERLLRVALIKDPGNNAAQALLTQVQERREETVGKVIRDKLRAIILDEVHFVATPIQSILDYLADESQRLSPDRSGVNFVLKAPDDHKFAPVTLRMKKTPMFDVLKYACDLSGATFQVDEAKVTVSPRPAAAP
jgi:hypothetical protein